MSRPQRVVFCVHPLSTVLTPLTCKSCWQYRARGWYPWQLGAQWAEVFRTGYSSFQQTWWVSISGTGWGSVSRARWRSGTWWSPVMWTSRRSRTRQCSLPGTWWSSIPGAWRQPVLRTLWQSVPGARRSSVKLAWRFLVSFKGRVDTLVERL